MRIVALLAVRNEEFYMEQCLRHLHAQGIETCVIDNDSTDRTRAIAESFRGKGVFRIERFPYPGHYDWVGLLGAKQQLSAAIAADWFMHYDADEIREGAANYASLSAGICAADTAGFNAVSFDEFVFLPTSETERHEDGNYVETMQYYYYFEPGPLHHVKAWKNLHQPVDLVSSGGHRAEFAGRNICPVPFILRHYIVLSRAHAIAKYGLERIYAADEVAQRGWHGPRARFDAARLTFPKRETLRRVGPHGWDKSEPWRHHTFFGGV